MEGDKSGLQELVPDDTIEPMDITNEWTRTKGEKGSVSEKLEYIVNGTKYTVDGKRTILRPTEQERGIAKALSENYGKTVELVPQVVYPQGIQTPDYLIDGMRFDLKSPTGKGKNVLRDAIKKKKMQSHNFIFDVTASPLSLDEIERQVELIFTARNTAFVEKIVIMKDGKILKVYDRK